MKAIENAAFIENGRCWRIEIFWKSIIEYSSCKCYHMTHAIRNRESDTSEKLVTRFREKNSRFEKKAWSESFFFQKKIERSRIRGTSELKSFYNLMRNFSICEIYEIFLIFFLKKCTMIPCCCLTIECIDITSFLIPTLRKICLELDSCFFCEKSDSFTKFNLFNLHEEIDRSSSFSTRKTMSNIFLWRYDKRRRLLTMKWTESFVIDSCFFHIDISRNDVEDIDTRFDVFTK